MALISTAKNGVGPKEFFNEREEFNEAFPTKRTQIDLWKEIPYYGKVDTEGDVILVRESRLKYLSRIGDPEMLACLDFVTDAFDDLRTKYESEFRSGVINPNSKFFTNDLVPKRAWESSNSFYGGHIDEFYFGLLGDRLIPVQHSNQIKNFDDFLKVLLSYIRDTEIPMSRVSFHEGPDASSLSTGMVIDLFDLDEGDDSIRQEFMGDPNFEFFCKRCVEFGFKLDKGMPWRLVFDIRSEKALPYISRYIKIPDNPVEMYQSIFGLYYYPLFGAFNGGKEDYFAEFRSIVETMYNAFKNIAPFYYEFIGSDGVCGNIIKKVNERPPIEIEDPAVFFLNFFYKVRQVEINAKLTLQRQKFHETSFLHILKTYRSVKKEKEGLNKALKYINYNLGTLAARYDSLNNINLRRKQGSGTIIKPELTANKKSFLGF